MAFKKSQIPKDAINTKEIDSIYKFLIHIDWSEPFLQGVILFHILTFILVLVTRKRVNFQGTLFVIFLGSIGATEKINAWMAENYKKFVSLQYFDSQGMFISLLYSGPVLVNCVIILINWFVFSGNLLVEVKRKELAAAQKKAEQSKKEE